jgi:tetratricopeptide (TPR) repeat protein
MSARASLGGAASFAAGRWTLALLFLLGLALRLAAWQWREFYPLGGDEREYLAQALTLLRERRYVELELMRPPLYTIFLSACIYLFDQLIQRLRLIQALIAALTVPLVGLLARELALAHGRERSAARDSLVAALLAALSYTLALAATELLAETVFLAGLSLCLWLIVRAARVGRWPWALAGGLCLGALALTRTVALPLLPLGALYLLAAGWRVRPEAQPSGIAHRHSFVRASLVALIFAFATALVIAPWTLRNYLAYGAPILIDTTGAENLWLDNDPAGRDAAKAQLLALGDDRAARQELALVRGRAAILADPARFAAKAWGELTRFFALEHADALRDKPAIWLPRAEVAFRLLLGDGIWLLMIFAAAIGLWLMPAAPRGVDPRWLLVPWALSLVVSCMVFHVEARYRLPLYPALLPYAAFGLSALVAKIMRRETISFSRLTRPALAALTLVAIAGLTLAHRPYLAEGTLLARKHLRLWQAERALSQEQPGAAAGYAEAALRLDPRSALARVALARAALAQGDASAAEAWLREAIASIPAHPHAHLLLGDLLRAQGRLDEARAELGYETGSLEDLQAWAVATFPRRALSARLDLGDLDLGRVRGVYPCIQSDCPVPRLAEPYRWTSGEARLLVDRPASGRLRLFVAAPRPAAAPTLTVLLDGQVIGDSRLSPGWQILDLPLPPGAPGPGWLSLRVETFRPRENDPASPDARELGIQVDWVETVGD